MTALERNGDVVHMASYAPLLCKMGHFNWRPDLIYFDNTRVVPSVNYYVQQLFGCNAGETFFAPAMDPVATNVAVSCVEDSASGDLILKLVNVASNAVPAHLVIANGMNVKPDATRTVLTGNPQAEDTFRNPDAVLPKRESMAVANTFDCNLPACSFTLIRMKSK